MDKEKPKLIPVRLVEQTGKSALVEWSVKGSLKRGSIPVDKVAEKVDQDVLDAAVPYGVPWSAMLIKQFTGEDLEKAMHDADIWTVEQAYKNARKVVGALQALYLVHLGSLLEFAVSIKQ